MRKDVDVGGVAEEKIIHMDSLGSCLRLRKAFDDAENTLLHTAF